MVYYKNRDIPANWDREPSEETLSRLNQVEYYRRAVDEHGFDVEQFNEIHSLIENEEDFLGAARQMVEYVGNFL